MPGIVLLLIAGGCLSCCQWASRWQGRRKSVEEKGRRRHLRYVAGRAARRKADRPPGSYPRFDLGCSAAAERRLVINQSGRPPAGGGHQGGAALTAQPAEVAAEGSFAGPWQNRDRRGAARLARVFLEQGAKTARLSP